MPITLSLVSLLSSPPKPKFGRSASYRYVALLIQGRCQDIKRLHARKQTENVNKINVSIVQIVTYSGAYLVTFLALFPSKLKPLRLGILSY